MNFEFHCLYSVEGARTALNLGGTTFGFYPVRVLPLSHSEIFEFQDVIKIKNKQQFNHNSKIIPTFIFFFTGNLV